jgi:hypothetical protein
MFQSGHTPRCVGSKHLAVQFLELAADATDETILIAADERKDVIRNQVRE